MERPLSSFRVLVVDDCVPARVLTREILSVIGCQVSEAENAEDGLALLDRQPVDVLVCDLRLPGRSGVWLATEAMARGLARRVVAVSGGGQIGGVDWLDAARMAGIERVLSKPVPLNSLLEAVLDGRRQVTEPLRRAGARP